MLTITKKLDMSPHGVPQVIRVSQYDSDFTLEFKLFASGGNFAISTGTTAEIRGTKQSGTGYSASATLDTSNKIVTVAGAAQMTAVAGMNIFEIVLKKNNKEISSANFCLLVERAALDADTITDESVLKELDAIIESADTATQAAEEAEDAADRAEAAAQTLVIDSAPIEGSAHAVSSGGTYDALNKIFSIAAKNLLLDILRHIDYVDDDALEKFNALENALFSGGQPILPSEYQQVEYIKGDGGQYIILDINSQIPLMADVRASFYGEDVTLLCAGSASVSNSRYYMIGYSIQGPLGRWKLCYRYDGAAWEGGDDFAPKIDTVYNITAGIEYTGNNQAKAFIQYENGRYESTMTIPSVGYPINIMRMPQNNSMSQKIKLYSCKLYSNGNLIFNGIPCYKKADGYTGLYDLVSDTFFHNDGTGEFELGSNVN